jgi:hypothetical protein
MKINKTILASCLAIASFTTSAVTIVQNADNSGYAYGILDPTQTGSITCARSEGVAYDSYSAYTSVWCSAYDGSGESAFCFTSNPDFAKAIQGLSDSGRLLFRWSTTGECSAMQIVNSTTYLPAP